MTTVFLFMAIGISILAVIVIGGVTVVSSLFRKGDNNPNLKGDAKDVFMYLGIAITLVISVVNFIQIVFTAIDIKWQDTAKAAAYNMYNDDVRMAIATLIVLFPLYILFSWLASQSVRKNPEKKELLVRKSTIYTALFVTACTLVGTLISIIYTYLGGDLSSRFEMKALFIAVLSAFIFGYYYYLLKRDFSRDSLAPLMLIIVSSALVLGSVVWSINQIGTPGEIRLVKLDDTRLQDLSNIQQQINNHFQTTDKLPTSLADLNDAFQGYVVPVDPVTKSNYEYRVLQQGVVVVDPVTRTKSLSQPAKFELCANFDTMRQLDAGGLGGSRPVAIDYSYQSYYYPGDNSPFWNHDKGRQCFERSISGNMYYGK